MNVKDASRIVIDDSRVTLQIVASLTDDSRGVIYDCNMFMVQATGQKVFKTEEELTQSPKMTPTTQTKAKHRLEYENLPIIYQ